MDEPINSHFAFRRGSLGASLESVSLKAIEQIIDRDYFGPYQYKLRHNCRLFLLSLVFDIGELNLMFIDAVEVASIHPLKTTPCILVAMTSYSL
jgi:hypothetical protein